MIELPEALNIAGQINGTIYRKRIASVIAAQTPHKLVWYYGEPSKYSDLLVGKTIEKANAYGGIEDLLFSAFLILTGQVL
jgi:formamidopyrimidine-DNA glycosylase